MVKMGRIMLSAGWASLSYAISFWYQNKPFITTVYSCWLQPLVVETINELIHVTVHCMCFLKMPVGKL